MKILVVDDSQATQVLVMQALRRLPGAEFLSAANGREALAIVGMASVALVVTGVQMPEMDGVTLVHELRRSPASADLPILLVASAGDEHASDSGFGSEADACVHKPLSREELVVAARRLLARRRRHAQEDPAR